MGLADGYPLPARVFTVDRGRKHYSVTVAHRLVESVRTVSGHDRLALSNVRTTDDGYYTVVLFMKQANSYMTIRLTRGRSGSGDQRLVHVLGSVPDRVWDDPSLTAASLTHSSSRSVGWRMIELGQLPDHHGRSPLVAFRVPVSVARMK